MRAMHYVGKKPWCSTAPSQRPVVGGHEHLAMVFEEFRTLWYDTFQAAQRGHEHLAHVEWADFCTDQAAAAPPPPPVGICDRTHWPLLQPPPGVNIAETGWQPPPCPTFAQCTLLLADGGHSLAASTTLAVILAGVTLDVALLDAVDSLWIIVPRDLAGAQLRAWAATAAVGKYAQNVTWIMLPSNEGRGLAGTTVLLTNETADWMARVAGLSRSGTRAQPEWAALLLAVQSCQRVHVHSPALHFAGLQEAPVWAGLDPGRWLTGPAAGLATPPPVGACQQLIADVLQNVPAPVLTAHALRTAGPADRFYGVPVATLAQRLAAVLSSRSPPLESACAVSACAVVGNGHGLLGSSLGPRIDGDHDLVFRINQAPTRGFEADVGARTSVRVMGPDLLDPTNWPDFLVSENSTRVFLVTHRVMHPANVQLLADRITNDAQPAWALTPQFRAAAWDLVAQLGRKPHAGSVGPSTGWLVLLMALRACHTVNLFGFSLMSTGQPELSVPYHYYPSPDRFSAPDLTGHDFGAESAALHALLARAGPRLAIQ